MLDCASAAAGVGLDPAVGYPHEERLGRLCLALDLMEELRVPVVDRLVVAMLNRGQVGVGDFVEEESGGARLKDPARKAFLVAYQEAKQVEAKHLFLEQQAPWGRVPHLQALLLARSLRRDLEAYPRFGESRLDPPRWVQLRARLLSEYDSEEDSLGFYLLRDGDTEKKEHHGQRAPVDATGPLVV